MVPYFRRTSRILVLAGHLLTYFRKLAGSKTTLNIVLQLQAHASCVVTSCADGDSGIFSASSTPLAEIRDSTGLTYREDQGSRGFYLSVVTPSMSHVSRGHLRTFAIWREVWQHLTLFVNNFSSTCIVRGPELWYQAHP